MDDTKAEAIIEGIDGIVQEVTNDFCSAFTEDKDYTGFTARLVGSGQLPECVDPQDERVIAIVARCKKEAG